jgi:PAS domain S-box-containing protein
MWKTMALNDMTIEQLLAENESLRRRLEEAEEKIRAIRSGQVDAFVVARDEHDEAFARETADRPYRLFVQSMQQGAVTLDRDGTILFCNEYFANLLKTPLERLAGAALREFVADEDPATYESLISTGQGELLLRRADGTTVPASLRIHPLAEDSHQITLCVLVTNLTEQKHYEQLTQTQAALAASEKELRARAARLSEADRRKDEFLATLAHELRNPLAPIRTGLEVMKMAGDFPPAMEEIRAMMERQTLQIVTLIDDLLDISRITQGKMQLRTCRVTLADIVQSALEASNPYMVEAGHELIVNVPTQPILLEADPHRLTQVISNLLNNAAKYTKGGGHIWLTAERQGSDVVVTVKDTGIGIPVEMLDRVFELFAQIDRPMERGYTGLGIGLTLVKSLVEMHRGQIEVRSEGANQGSEFRVRLPILVEFWSSPLNPPPCKNYSPTWPT